MPKEIPLNHFNNNDEMPLTKDTLTVGATEKEKFSAFATKYLREMAKNETEGSKRRTQINTAEILYGHLASGSQATYATPRATAKAVGIPTPRARRQKSLDEYLSDLVGKPTVEVLNIGDPLLATAGKRVTVLDPVIKREKSKGAKVVRGVFPETPFANESFDAIVCKNSIGYPMADMTSEQIAVTMDELLRLTKKDGWILIDPIEYQTNDSRGPAFC